MQGNLYSMRVVTVQFADVCSCFFILQNSSVLRKGQPKCSVTLGAHQRGADPCGLNGLRNVTTSITDVSLKLFLKQKDKCTLRSSALWTCLVPVSTFQSHCCKDKQFLLKHKVAQRHTTFCFTLRPPEGVLALSCANMSCCAFAKTTWWCCFNAVRCFKLQFYGAFQCLHVCVCRTGTPFLSVSPVP